MSLTPAGHSSLRRLRKPEPEALPDAGRSRHRSGTLPTAVGGNRRSLHETRKLNRARLLRKILEVDPLTTCSRPSARLFGIPPPPENSFRPGNGETISDRIPYTSPDRQIRRFGVRVTVTTEVKLDSQSPVVASHEPDPGRER